MIAVRVNGELRDLAAPLADGDVVEPVELASDDGRTIMRHSTAHVLAQAVQDLFPEAKLGIGPPIENGFYYDFDVARPVRPRGPEDDRAADARRSSSRASGSPAGRSATRQARAELAGEPYKLELIGLKGGGGAPRWIRRRARSASRRRSRSAAAELTIYDNLDPATGAGVLEGPVPGPARADHPRTSRRSS